MIEVRNLYLAYSKEFFTLNDISFSVEKGKRLVLLGEKESGKSSLVRVVAGLESPTKGEVLLYGKPISKIDFKKDVKLGYLSRFGAFLNNKSVRKNLEYVLKIRGLKKFEIENKVNMALLSSKLEDLADFKIKELSDYDKLQVAILRLRLRPVEILVVDDIFEGLFENEIESLVEKLNDLIVKNENCTVLIAVSNLKIAHRFNSEILKLKYGSIVE